MNRNKKIGLTAIILAVVIIAIASTYILIGLPAKTNLLPPGEPPQAQIALTGDITAEKTFTVKDLSNMPLVNVTNTIKGETASYVGVTLLTLLNKANAGWDTGNITVIGSDGYNKTINFYQTYNSTQYPGSEVILAFVKNGKWITDKSIGPFILITPGFAPAYNVKTVVQIDLKPWAIDIAGTNAPLELIGSNITNYGAQTVQAEFAPGGQPQITANWTGVNLWTVLQAAGVPADAFIVTVTAVDGYSRSFTLAQVQSTGMMIGFQENGQYLTSVNGQPYRLFVPTEDYKWGQYWVRWVTQITVS